MQALAVIGAAASIACAHTSMSSVVAPDARGKAYQRVLVFFDVSDLALRKEGESEFASQDRNRYLPSVQYFLPGRQYTPEDTAKTLEDTKVDAVLVLTPGEAGTNAKYVPGTSTTTCTAYDDRGNCKTTQTSSTAGYDVNSRWANYTATLFDIAQHKQVWVASAKSSGDALTNDVKLAKSVASKTVSQLQEDGMVAKSSGK